MSKKILITGGAGFLGSHLCERLLNEGNQIFCVDNFYTGFKKNIEHLLDNKNFELIEHNVIQPLPDIEVDQIYNLACPASPPHYQQDPLFTTNTAIFGVLNCLELGKKYGARVFQASTSEVYGDPLVHPQPEDYWGSVNPIGIRSCYDEGKRVGETYMFDYHRQYGVDIRVVRIFNTYGPRMNPEDGRVVSNFIVQALKGENITIYGDGKQTRSFCYVDDLIEGFVRLMNQDEILGPMNCGNPGEFTMLELAEKVLEKVESNSKLTFHALPRDDPKQRKPDISLAKEKLAWKPEVNLSEGLDKAITYFSNVI